MEADTPKPVSIAKPVIGSATTVSVTVAIAGLTARYLKAFYHIDLDATDMLYLLAVVSFFCNLFSSFGNFIGSVARAWLKRQGLMENNGGFTLIELMVVITIMGVLATIAIPRFMGFRKRAFDAAAKHDLNTVSVSQAAYMASEGRYAASVETLKEQPEGLQLSPDIEVEISVDGDAYTATARSTKCAPQTGQWTFSSTTGKIEGKNCE